MEPKPANTPDPLSVARQCWCGSASARRVGQFDCSDVLQPGLVQCEGCGVMCLWPMPTDDELIPFYAQEYYGTGRKKFVRPIADLVAYFQSARARLVAGHAPRGGRVLDVGCGNGGFLTQMKDRGWEAEGTEWTAQSAARISSDAGIPVHVGDLLTLDLPTRSFDAITLWHVFEHLRHPDRTLAAINRLLKDDGRLFLSMPNVESWQAEKFGVAWFHHDPPRHLHGFGPRSLEALLKQNGFSITKVSTWSLEQNPYGFIQSWLNRKGFPRDLAYGVLKGTVREPASLRRRQLAWVALLLPPALAHSLLEAAYGRGATMTLTIQKVSSSDSRPSAFIRD